MEAANMYKFIFQNFQHNERKTRLNFTITFIIPIFKSTW